MSELVERLLAEETDLTDCAADRIEQLEDSHKGLTLQLLAVHGQAADALHVKLTKAVKMGNAMASFIRSHYIVSVAADWEDMVAELEGK